MLASVARLAKFPSILVDRLFVVFLAFMASLVFLRDWWILSVYLVVAD